MPIYDYECTLCESVVELMHGANDELFVFCSKGGCEGLLCRVFLKAPLGVMATMNSKGQWIGDSAAEIKKQTQRKKDPIYFGDGFKKQ